MFQWFKKLFFKTPLPESKLSKDINNVFVGEILKIEPHPNADRLQLTEVTIGNNKIFKIVCGANNIQVGQKVPVAIAGAILPNNLKIDKVKIRGVESEGMICSEKELGIAEEAEGIMVLDEGTEVGTDIKNIL